MALTTSTASSMNSTRRVKIFFGASHSPQSPQERRGVAGMVSGGALGNLLDRAPGSFQHAASDHVLQRVVPKQRQVAWSTAGRDARGDVAHDGLGSSLDGGVTHGSEDPVGLTEVVPHR